MADRTTFPTEYNGTSETAMNAALLAASGVYTAAYVATMTVNDKIYAMKQLAKNTTLPPADGNTAWVNPWEQDGA